MKSALDAALRAVGWEPSEVSFTSLYGGITNKNYRVDAGPDRFVLRINGRSDAALGIDRRREWRCARLAARLGVGPEVEAFLPKPGILVTRFIQGLTLSKAAAAQPETLKRVAAAIRRYHDGPAFPGAFSPFRTVRRYHALARRRGARFPSALPEALAGMNRIEKALGVCRKPRPCHNDLLAGNFIDDGGEIRIIDWEYAAMGDPFFDLGNYAVNQGLSEAGRELLLREYRGEVRVPELARLNLHRLSSDLREAFWGFLQSRLSDLKFDFSKYGAKHLDRFLREAAGPRFEGWLEEAAAR